MNIEFIPIDIREFKELEFEVTKINSQEELIEKLNNINLEENNLYKIILIGKRNFEIENIYKFINRKNIIKIKNKTKLKINLGEISKNNNLKGLVVKEILQELNNNNYSKETLENVLSLGLEIIDKK